MPEPLYDLITAFENPKFHFYICAVITHRFCNQMDRWASQYVCTSCVCDYVRLLKYNVQIRGASKNYNVVILYPYVLNDVETKYFSEQ
jgi:hypothetical protein